MTDDGYIKDGLVFAMSGGLLVDTAKNNTITNNGATLTTDHNGRANRGWAFDGVDDNIVLGNNNNFDFGTEPFAITTSFTHKSETTALSSILTRYVDANNYWALAYRIVNNYIEFRIVIGGVVKTLRALKTQIAKDVPHLVTVIIGRSTNAIVLNASQRVAQTNEITNENFNFNADVVLGKMALANSAVVFESDITYFKKGIYTVSDCIKDHNVWLSH